MFKTIGLLSERKRQALRDRFRSKVKRIVYEDLDRYGEAQPLNWTEGQHERFTREVLERLRKENPDELGFAFTLLFWILQGTVLFFVQKWWKEREERKKKEEADK